MDFLRASIAKVQQGGSSWHSRVADSAVAISLKVAPKQRYERVKVGDEADVDAGAGSFTIDEDGGEELSIDQLVQRHKCLVSEAEHAISATESSVQWLREERQQHEHKVLELQAAANAQLGQPRALEASRKGSCCPCFRTRCIIS
ncbi:hypothetical protein AB1Y20_000113 [Prymnesium parvum]|uniref:Uncharacterized protein n=1 Tax=Prymnesium parvum TaxID=97485 RepID=A0AB34K403_PRYPA